ncbi:MAG: hypothetical protein D3906_11950 [Candidatus Electrothrix sp. AUS1_2]|nr:hypothetical protein [Candidatus Electrothrix sp. AUS1_2]
MKKHGLIFACSVVGLAGISNIAEAALELEFEIPILTITVDGNPDDWTGISPYLSDDAGDSTQGYGTDIESLYLCRDNSYLYWRMDTWSGSYNYLDSYNDGPSLVFQSDNQEWFIDVRNAVSSSSWGYLERRNPDGSRDRLDGDAYAINSVAEGKIPLSTFSVADFSCLWGYYGAEEHYDIIGNRDCDSGDDPPVDPIDQICPCENNWKNHGEYVRCVAHTSEAFLLSSLITEEEKDYYVSSAAQSDCGGKK